VKESNKTKLFQRNQVYE